MYVGRWKQINTKDILEAYCISYLVVGGILSENVSYRINIVDQILQISKNCKYFSNTSQVIIVVRVCVFVCMSSQSQLLSNELNIKYKVFHNSAIH